MNPNETTLNEELDVLNSALEALRAGDMPPLVTLTDAELEAMDAEPMLTDWTC